MDRFDWLTGAIVAAAVLLVAGLCYMAWRSEQDCINHGGHEVITGYSVYSTGKSTTISPDYTCEGAH